MDSGNSSSLQSSSGGDDQEYDSKRESVPAFLNTSGHFSGALSNPHPSLVSNNHHHQQPTFSDPWPSYLNSPFSQSQLLYIDGVRPGNLKYDPSCIDNGNLPDFSSLGQLGPQGLNRGSFPSSSSFHTRPPHDNNGVRSSTKNPKKRSRASRREPTTVLTTDTTNFRAMVQEFTGIPTPPFPGSSSFSRRLDLFGSGSGFRSGHLEPLGSLLRPSVGRVQPNPFASSSSSPSLLNNPLVDAANTIIDINFLVI
ncbi:putative carbohydrate transporter [Hibiscus syriacus]|uniref:Carbohydrate transporter n=1 Tax=Hibiscus syriacus TaxID=106335 RepID=A0A6A3BRS1_HIBSY|nr:putative carbohydrate transporter [Hibiscus syriacus]